LLTVPFLYIIEDNPPIQEIVDANIVPRIIQLLDLDTYPRIQYEAAWCLTNIATGDREHVLCIVEKGVIRKLAKLLNSKDDGLKEQAMWALCNIAGEDIDFRDSVLSEGVFPILLNILKNTTKPSLIKNGCWELATLLRDPLHLPFENVKEALEFICKTINESEESETLNYACQALADVEKVAACEAQSLNIQCVFPRLIQLLK